MDYYSNRFTCGEIFTLVEVHFLPYRGGYTVVFREKKLYLQEDANADILHAFGSCLRLVAE
jgi:hypothetical protein